MAPLVQTLREENARDGLRLVQDFVTAASGAGCMADLRSLIEDATRELGFDHFAVIHHVQFGRPTPGNVRLTNYPLEWVGVHREAKVVDPVLRAAERASSGFKWDQLEKLLVLTQADSEHMQRAAVHGIVQGYTVPNHVPGETFGSCTLRSMATATFRKRTSLPRRPLAILRLKRRGGFSKCGRTKII